MSTTRTIAFRSATIAGIHFEFRSGHLVLRTEASGLREWSANAEYRSVSLDLGRISGEGAVRVEFDTETQVARYAGQAVVGLSISSGAGVLTIVRMRGTGELEGWVA